MRLGGRPAIFVGENQTKDKGVIMKDFTNRTYQSNRKIIEKIELWLKSPDTYICPFYGQQRCNYYCGQVFPCVNNDPGCPCDHYTLKYIIRIAKQAVRELGG